MNSTFAYFLKSTLMVCAFQENVKLSPFIYLDYIFIEYLHMDTIGFLYSILMMMAAFCVGIFIGNGLTTKYLLLEVSKILTTPQICSKSVKNASTCVRSFIPQHCPTCTDFNYSDLIPKNFVGQDEMESYE